ncbi:multidrug transporter [Fictibacillus sp. b24]|nr:multidrug transporter [Fictibacillus sp. b24]MDM5315163.1 multidrug transporter [Fictibacillus sp. b24]
MRDSYGTSGQVETPKGKNGRRLTVRPVESEQPGAETNYFQEQQSSL